MNWKNNPRYSYVYYRPLTATIGLATLLTGLLFTIAPGFALSSSSLGEFLPDTYELAWPITHSLAGGLVLYGMFRNKPNYEAAGLTLLFFTFTCSWLGVFITRGFESGVVAGSTILAVAVGCLLRAIMLIRETPVAE